MMLKAILCVQHSCSFDAMQFIVNLLIKTDSTVICVFCMLEYVFMSHCFYKVADLEDILYYWLNFV